MILSLFMKMKCKCNVHEKRKGIKKSIHGVGKKASSSSTKHKPSCKGLCFQYAASLCV